MKPKLPSAVACVRCNLPITGTDYIEAPGLGLVAHGREMQCIAALHARIIELEAKAKVGELCRDALRLIQVDHNIDAVGYMKRAEKE